MPRHRTAIVCTSVALAASGTLIAGTAHAANDAAKTTDSYAYQCKIKAGGFVIDPAKVKVTMSAKLPGSVDAGSTIGKRKVHVTLRMPEVIRDNAVSVLRARKANGSARDAHVDVRIAKKTDQIPVKGLHAKKRRIPRKAGAVWNIHATGKVAAIKVPKNASGKAKVSVPKRLRVKANLFRRNGSKIKASMACKAPKDRAFDTIKITG
ncbi:DUF6801 domain-containing protein [Solicola gregarius]|uniref:DUF6801 domain-containing protein n=1 Tax=Solicola gregarius TaxID=2908642 RepID=A0AA46TKX3_9ACTN|nr:DUF6801 domain-containing protein [Solicola gregarius]UYM07209.1 hypothetical protein L0C25_09075 [Solicola gregarius]